MKKDLASKAMTKCRDVFLVICNVNLFSDMNQGDDEVTMCMLLDMAEERGMERGVEQGKEQGVGQGISRVNLLNIRLAEEGRTDDIIAAAKDLELQHELMDLYGI